MKDIKLLVKRFRDAIDIAKDEGEFDEDFTFYNFPRGCCGDASDLLAHYLLENGIRTYYVCGMYSDSSFENIQTHAWLLTDNQTIIDITGDQFRDNPDFLNNDKSVYVGAENNFYRLFKVEDRDIHEHNGLDTLNSICRMRLNGLYQKIIKYI